MDNIQGLLGKKVKVLVQGYSFLNCILLEYIEEGSLRGFIRAKNVDDEFKFYLNPSYIEMIEELNG
jgi:hypothetical protein